MLPDLIDERFEIEETYLDLINLAEQLKLESRPNISEVLSAQIRDSSSSNLEQNSNGSILKRRIKLPEASLPKFDGRYKEWLSLKKCFYINDR